MKEHICIWNIDDYRVGDIVYADCDGFIAKVWLSKTEFESHFMLLEEFIEIRNKKIDDILK